MCCRRTRSCLRCLIFVKSDCASCATETVLTHTSHDGEVAVRTVSSTRDKAVTCIERALRNDKILCVCWRKLSWWLLIFTPFYANCSSYAMLVILQRTRPPTVRPSQLLLVSSHRTFGLFDSLELGRIKNSLVGWVCPFSRQHSRRPYKRRI